MPSFQCCIWKPAKCTFITHFHTCWFRLVVTTHTLYPKNGLHRATLEELREMCFDNAEIAIPSSIPRFYQIFMNYHNGTKCGNVKCKFVRGKKFKSDDDFVYNSRSENQTFQVQNSNLTYAFMNFSNIEWRSFQVSRMVFLDVLFTMSNCKLRFSNAIIFLLFCFGFSVANLHLRNAIWHYQIAFWNLHYSFI